MTPVVPIGEKRVLFSEDCDNTGGEPALKSQTSSGANNQNTGFRKVCWELRNTEKDKAWLALSMLTSWEKNSLNKGETIQGLQERAQVQAGVSATGNFEMYINKTG